MRAATTVLLVSGAAVSAFATSPNVVYDMFKILEAFDRIVGVATSKPDSEVLCLAARRVALDRANRGGTYEWSWYERSVESPRIKVNFTFGGVGTLDSLTNPDPQVGDANVRLLFSDYSTCALTKFSRRGEVCVLWIPEQVNASISTVCDDHFERHCGSERKALLPDDRCTQGMNRPVV
ncbi:uncharacterized protein LOC119455360 [Dermacentor silvarum]|uniref:uncharacterized protein LOC119455360 n=1 Tax=Dermacentor silvarum TaxID=543639 RepID=UPI0018982DFE|nr:uncharacterized protein LOC119455360 [Dermacentor silvarum]